jgi:photosystem I P700 chlorophyll a apoprotein A1
MIQLILSSQVVWPIVGQEILNGDVGGNFKVFKQLLVGSKCGVQKVSLVKLNYTGLQWWIKCQLIMLFAGWFHYHKAAPN